MKLQAPVVMIAIAVAAAASAAEFTSIAAGGKWSDPATWTVADKPAGKVPAEGDTVTIKGKLLIDAPVTIGAGEGDAIVFAPAAKLGDNALGVSAPLNVRGSIRFGSHSLLEVQAGAGIELDANADKTPAIHAAHGSAVNLVLRGTADKRCYLRAKPGTKGNAARIMPDANYVPVDLGATFTDFAGFSDPAAYGIVMLPGKDLVLPALRDCTFSRCSLSFNDLLTNDTVFTFENLSFKDSPVIAAGGQKFCASFAGTFNFSLLNVGIDQRVYVDQARDIKSCVFGGMIQFYQYHAKGFETWVDNVVVVIDPPHGFFVPRPGTYTRTYILCASDMNNAHVVGAYTGAEKDQNITFDQCLWDVPLTKGYIDDSLMNSGDVTVRRAIVLPRVGGEYPRSGCNIGYVMGGPIKYEYNTIALGHECAVHSDPSHRGKAGEIVSFRNNCFFVLDGLKDEKGTDAVGRVFMCFGGLKDPVAPKDCDYNNLFRSNYGQIELTVTGKLGEHDVAVDPRFVDPTRNLTSWYRAQPNVKSGTAAEDVPKAIDFIRQHPERTGEMIGWVRAGYVPTNPALKVALDANGPTGGWLGAMEGQ